MATRATKATPKTAARKRATKTAKPRAPAARKTTASSASAKAPPFAQFGKVPDFTQMAKSAKLLSPEQAIELYKANSKMALDVINAAIEGTARVRRLQFDGEEQARAFGRRAVKQAASAGSPSEMMVAGQGAAKEAVENAMAYWGQMFELISEIQKRLFTLIEAQMADVPGVKQTKAAMAMMPDLSQAQNVVRALQGVVTSGGGAMEQMQKVMADFARMSRPR